MITSKFLTATILTATILTAGAHGAGATEDPTCVHFGNRFVRGETANTETRPVDLPAGTYVVTLDTEDGYDNRSNSPVADQDSERVEVYGIVTPDLEDGVEYATAAATGTVTLDGAISEVTVTHVHGLHGYQSVQVNNVCFAPVEVHGPVTVPEVAPETVPVPAPVPAVDTPTTTTPAAVPVPVEAPKPIFNG